jgi:hypothetical protein
MALLETLVQTVADWSRGIIMDVLGRRVEREVEKWLKKWRRRRRTTPKH